jgi:hypothetical protein
VGGAAGDRCRQGTDTMTAALASEFTLSDDQLRTAASRAGVDGLPTVLKVRSRHTTIDRREAAFGRAARELLSRRLIIDGAVHPELVEVLQTLHRPDRELAMRLVTPDGEARISVVRRGTLSVSARRTGEDIRLRIIGHTVDLHDAVSALLAEMPAARPADVAAVGAPLQEFSEMLSGTHDQLCLADRIRALGAERHAAMLLGSALASRRAFAEIVYCPLVEGEDRIMRGPAAVAVFYTGRGRIVAAPSVSPTGQLWTTLKPGSDRVIRQAISQLIDLARQTWGMARDAGT